MPLRAFTFGLAASAIILSTVAGLPTPAQAAVPASCSETATVSAGIPDLLSSTVIGNPLAINVPLFGTPGGRRNRPPAAGASEGAYEPPGDDTLIVIWRDQTRS